jgi:hypothetical protein
VDRTGCGDRQLRLCGSEWRMVQPSPFLDDETVVPDRRDVVFWLLGTCAPCVSEFVNSRRGVPVAGY